MISLAVCQPRRYTLQPKSAILAHVWWPISPMYFPLIDRITELDTLRIVTQKQLRPDEPYLQDHFPGFPVMPGVLMMESAFQTCGWLLCVADRFQQGFPRLSDVRNVKFGSFVRPGDTLQLSAEVVQQKENHTTLQVRGCVGEHSAVSGRWVLAFAESICDQPTEMRSHHTSSSPPSSMNKELEHIFQSICEPNCLLEPVDS